jgi:leucyl aminopeptidase (aminopeptidase T)
MSPGPRRAVELDSQTRKAATIAIKEVIGARPGENILIITNPSEDVLKISHAIYEATLSSKASPTLVVQETKTLFDLAEDSVIKAIQSNPDVVISISEKKLGKDRFGLKTQYSGVEKDYDHIFTYLKEEKKLRSFWSPSISLDMFKRTIPINYQDLRRRAAKLKRVLDASDYVHAESTAGMDIKIGLEGRLARKDDGNFRKPGLGGNLPAGEVYISPELGNSEGSIVFDGSMATGNGELIIKDPIHVAVEGGFVTKIRGKKEARVLRKAVKKGEESAMGMHLEGKFTKVKAKQYARNAKNLGELGIGLNPKAKIVGNILEDEKVLGTCHVALGSNYDEDSKAMIHLDGIIHKPTLTAYKGYKPTVLMKVGKLERRFL